MIIRRATIDDLKTVQQLGFELLKYEHDRWDDTLDLDWPFSEAGEANYRKAILERVTLLAEDDGRAAGFLIGSIQKAAPGAARNINSAQLNNIYVRDEWRGKKVGQSLADEFKKLCEAEDVSAINVTVNSKNEAAIGFYERVGFASSRIIMSMDIKEKNGR